MPLTADTSTTSRCNLFALSIVAGALLLGLAVGGIWVTGQVAMAPSTVPAYLAVNRDFGNNSLSGNSSLSSSTHAPQLRISPSGPIWREITTAQRQVLMPLRERWDDIGALAKRRWLVLADRYPQMDEAERNRLVSRMNTWANLSAQQRNQARLNFESARRLSAQELQKKWDEYQALSETEKKKLADQAQKTRAARKAKRRLAVPAAPVAEKAEALVITQPIAQPQAAPSLQLEPLHPAPEATSQPVAIPHSMPSVELPPLPALEPATDSPPSAPHPISAP